VIGILVCILGQGLAETLTLDDYLSQVSQFNMMGQAMRQSEQAAMNYRYQKDLLTTTQAFATANLSNDAKLQSFMILTYASLFSEVYSLGVRQQTSFGLKWSAHYDVSQQHYIKPSFSPALQELGFGNAVFTTTTNASVVFEATQNLLANGFGKSTQAQMSQIDATYQSQQAQSLFSFKQVLLDAELRYWNLTTTRRVMEIQEQALERAHKMHEWIVSRRALNLKEESDVYQSEAMLRAKRLDFQNAKMDERQARLALNLGRNQNSEKVEELLVAMEEALQKLPDRMPAPEREDVTALKFLATAKQQNVVVQEQGFLPNLDLSVSLATNGQLPDRFYTKVSDAMGRSFSLARPTETAALVFSYPLDRGIIAKNKQAARLDAMSTELQYDRKRLEQEQSYEQLWDQLSDLQKSLELSHLLEKTQLEKLGVEKKRLNQGRSTTYQILLFENDYLSSQLMTLNLQSSILKVAAQLKIFGGSYYEPSRFIH
jgi:outer membrane protein TolC